MKTRSWFKYASLFVLFGILLAACAPVAPVAPGTAATPASSQPAATTAPASQKPVVVLLSAEPVSYDNMFTQSDAHMSLTIHEGLFRLDNNGAIVPAIAESIRNIDPLNWEIKIRRGLVFHNDEPINADAVVFTFD